jgi:predicted ATPase
MNHLVSLEVREFTKADAQNFPFDLDVIRSLHALQFSAPVTFLVGENGSGKSTLLEAIACAAGSITIGAESVRTDDTLGAVRKLSAYFRLSWKKRTHKGFFLRAEDFFGYARRMKQTRQELQQDLRQVEQDYRGRSKYAADLARLPYARELGDIQRRYGAGLDSQSHGESFLLLFQSRFVPDGLYLLDEPEAALSPTRQLTFMAALKQMVAEESQFIIATHSPILLAFPGATILSFDGGRVQPVQYAELEHVRLTRDFLDSPQSFTKYL